MPTIRPSATYDLRRMQRLLVELTRDAEQADDRYLAHWFDQSRLLLRAAQERIESGQVGQPLVVYEYTPADLPLPVQERREGRERHHHEQ